MLSAKIKEFLSESFPGLDVQVSQPDNYLHGHYATNLAFALGAKEKISPMEAAKKIKETAVEVAPWGLLEKVEVAPPGFVNFFVSVSAIQNELSIISRNKNWGAPQPDVLKSRKGKTAIIEYSSPNIAKPMHIGHLRSTIIGDALANIYLFSGYKVIRWNYIGDWGTQFGKLIAAYKMWGDKKAVLKDPIKELVKLYVRFHQELEKNPELEEKGREEFKKLEDGEKVNKKLWAWFRKESLKEFEKIYRILGIKFNVSKGESYYEGKLGNLVEELLKRGIARPSMGGVIVETGQKVPALIQKSDGASLYLTRELANLQYRAKKYKPARILYVVGSEQSFHFEQLFIIGKILGVNGTRLFHIGHGLVLGEDNKKLSTREGKTVELNDVLMESISRAGETLNTRQMGLKPKEKVKIAQAVGVGAIKYNDLSMGRESDIKFDWDKMLDFQGNSGPYIQYTYARLKSILRKAPARKFDSKALSNEADLELVLILDSYPMAVEEAFTANSPQKIASYIYELSKAVNGFYQSNPVLQSERGVREARLALISACASTLKRGMELLGITPLERM
ncbi:MAG: arginine--tRNA ligase [Candidatus Colwellbacteria bacterium]|nr:arginine--tRNA ligase [Candidatus Colwellbacteria bacterium]